MIMVVGVVVVVMVMEAVMMMGAGMGMVVGVVVVVMVMEAVMMMGAGMGMVVGVVVVVMVMEAVMMMGAGMGMVVGVVVVVMVMEAVMMMGAGMGMVVGVVVVVMVMEAVMMMGAGMGMVVGVVVVVMVMEAVMMMGAGMGMVVVVVVYDVPPSVSKDVPDGPLLREETYDVPPAFAKAKPFDPTRHPLVLAAPPPDSSPAEDVYDVPPPAPDIYDVPPGLRRPGPSTLYDVPRERVLPPEVADGSVADDGVYVVPPSAEREAPADAKRLSASSTGSTRSSHTTEPQEPPAQDLRAAVAAVQGAVHELLEFARSAVGNSAHTSDRTLNAKLSRQLQKMEDVYQTLVAHGQTFDSSRGGPGATSEDLDRLVACSRAVPEDAKQLASFLHGNASLLFRRTKAPVSGPEGGGSLHPIPTDKASSIQSRPLPSPPKFTSQDSPDGQYENSEGGWMEDYDYVHLQGKEEFEKTQKELLEKGNIMRQGKGQLELQQLKQFERLEQEVSRPIDHDLTNWTSAQSLAPGRTGSLGPSDRQLLLFYLEQCEANLTTLTNAVDAFFTAVATNQPPKIFVAHSKFVILSAHKLVFIGDTLSRQAKAADVRSQVTHYSNLLCDLLRGIVATTKAAALQYPSPTAAQDMVDRVKELGHSTQQFRRVLGQLAAA
ncbi:Breast cancer anti-estrogen resistance protein 1 [Myotis brandtii]|uniref:Breast cancer anti-estrogen resistance protein 1 n=1 Tax=Myotis brandtii TaxID=109478 RepID=S7MML0_MYOBR|nr:Breast cancer anti-estrogen resistance protein 1 [Myotis brandtii]